MRRLSETYFREEPRTSTTPKSEKLQQIQEFAQKEKRAEIIKAWTEIKDHPEAEDMGSEVGSAFDKEVLDDEMQAVYDVIGEQGMVYATWEHSFWLRHKGKLIRVM